MATFGTFVDGVSLKASELNSFLIKTTHTPVVRQSVTITNGSNTRAAYSQVNKMVFYSATIYLTSAGTANNRIEVDLPVTAATNSAFAIGFGNYEDNSATDMFNMVAVRVSTTRVAFLTNSSTSLTTFLGQTGGPTLTIASPDVLFVTLFYEAA